MRKLSKEEKGFQEFEMIIDSDFVDGTKAFYNEFIFDGVMVSDDTETDVSDEEYLGLEISGSGVVDVEVLDDGKANVIDVGAITYNIDIVNLEPLIKETINRLDAGDIREGAKFELNGFVRGDTDEEVEYEGQILFEVGEWTEAEYNFHVIYRDKTYEGTFVLSSPDTSVVDVESINWVGKELPIKDFRSWLEQVAEETSEFNKGDKFRQTKDMYVEKYWKGTGWD